jgi:hypothetical protein
VDKLESVIASNLTHAQSSQSEASFDYDLMILWSGRPGSNRRDRCADGESG